MANWELKGTRLEALSREKEKMKIRTDYWAKPGPVRAFDWTAVDESTYDADCDQDGFFSKHPIGYGRTEEEAIADLKAQLEQNDG